MKNILKEHDLDPGPNRGKGTWDEYLKIHADTLWQCDFVSKPMWTVKGLIDLYFIVFLHLGARRCWISPCTLSPDSAWVSQQAKNFRMEADDFNLAPKYVIRGNDVKFTAQFDAAIEDQTYCAALSESAGARGAVHPEPEVRGARQVRDRGRTVSELRQPGMAAALQSGTATFSEEQSAGFRTTDGTDL